MKRIILILTGILMVFCATASALTGVKLLTAEAGARPVGMGGAFTSVTEDPYSVVYNPAASYNIGPLAGSIGHNTYWDNVRIETGYLSFQKKAITFSTGVQFAVDGNIQGRGDLPTSDFVAFDAHDVSFKAGASFRIDKDVIFGFMAGWIIEKIQTYSGSAMNFDVGLLTQPISKMNVGLAVLNVGGKMQINQEKYSLPTTFRAGASYRFEKFLPAVDVVVQDNDLHVHVGGEYAVTKEFFVRAGYRAGYDSKNISAGAGFAKRNFRIDYAFLPFKNELGDSHLINLTFHL